MAGQSEQRYLLHVVLCPRELEFPTDTDWNLEQDESVIKARLDALGIDWEEVTEYWTVPR
jgi:hypothetical protein